MGSWSRVRGVPRLTRRGQQNVRAELVVREQRALGLHKRAGFEGTQYKIEFGGLLLTLAVHSKK